MNRLTRWLLINLLVGCLYALLCYLAQQYMVRPTLSVTVWPATGLGVGLIMVWRQRIIPAIALGEALNAIFLYQVHLDFGWNTTTFYDMGLYITNILRPVLAGYMVQWFVGRQLRLIHFPEIFRFFLYASVVPCAFTTVLFVSLLLGAGHYSVDDFMIKGALWYMGDVMSVLIFAPIVLAFLGSPRSIWQPRILSVAFPVLIGFSMVYLLFNSFKAYEENKINQVMSAHLDHLEMAATERLDTVGDLIEYIDAHQGHMDLNNYKLTVNRMGADGSETIYQNQSTLTTRYTSLNESREFSLGDDLISTSMVPTNAFFAKESSPSLWLTLFIAFTFTGFVGVGMLTLTGRQILTDRAVQQRTLELNVANKQLKESNRNYERIVESHPVIFWKVNLQQDQITFVSKEAESILGYSVDQWLTEPHFFTKRIHPDDLGRFKQSLIQPQDDEKNVEMEYRIKHANGVYRWFRDVLHIPDDFNESHEVLGMLVDITEKKNDAEKIHHLAFHDYLTKLPNRQQFQSVLAELIEKGRQNQRYGAVLFLDLDRFKVLNDALGHHFGDRLLLMISDRLNEFASEFKVMARFGGDEFVLATGCEYFNSNDAAVQIIMLAEGIIRRLAEPYVIAEHQHICTVSMGIAMYPNGDSTVNDIIRQADVAMYRSKEQGRNQVTMYHHSMKQDNDKILYLEQVLRNAVSNDSFILKYQPIVDADRQVVCFESLIRIHNEEKTLFPDEFIPVAEDTDLIQSVGRWVISHACLKIMDCQHNISINVSSKQFHQQGFIMYIDQMLKRFNIGPGKLVIELTEGVVVGNANEILYKFNRLKELGVLIAIDDFGTGYSSLEYLRKLPIDYLKVDKSFVRDLGAEESSQVIIETIISMAKHLNLQTVAEGVETEAQFAILKDIGCDLFQGYLFGKPGDLIAIQ